MSKHDKDRLIADFDALLAGQKAGPSVTVDDPRLNPYRAIRETGRALLKEISGEEPFAGDDQFYAIADKDGVAYVALWTPDLDHELSGKYVVSGEGKPDTALVELGPRLQKISVLREVELADASSGEIKGRFPFGATIQTYRCTKRELTESEAQECLVRIEMTEEPDTVYLAQKLHVLIGGKELNLDPRIAHKSAIQMKRKYFADLKSLWKSKREAALSGKNPETTLRLRVEPTPALTNEEVRQLLDAVLDPKK